MDNLKTVNSVNGRQAEMLMKQTIQNVDTLVKTGNIDESRIQGRENSKKIQISISNTDSSADAYLTFGTPLGLVEEYEQVPLFANIPTGTHWLDNLATLVDNQGANAEFLQLLNRRFVRRPIIVSSIEVITDTTAKGEAQRRERIEHLYVPYNSATDSQKNGGDYQGLYTEFTNTELLKEAVCFGEFTGIGYKLLKATSGSVPNEISMNITIAATDKCTFEK